VSMTTKRRSTLGFFGCIICGKSFPATRCDALYCSNMCRTRRKRGWPLFKKPRGNPQRRMSALERATERRKALEASA